MSVREEVIERAVGNIAISKLAPVGEYLDLADAGLVDCNPSRYQALSVAAMEMVRQYRTNPQVRQSCERSQALAEMLENVDFEEGLGCLAASRAGSQSER